jgi:two-component system sensor histidine kinase KdpD
MANDSRPNPDKLLLQVQMEAAREKQGKLKIFFGSSPGVGKTYTMLEAARDRKAEGVDVVVGLIETHGRKETAALLEGLELLPPHEMEYHGIQLKEFDIDGALKRKPGLLLVDELAHTNVEGSRHLKRWQDVEELLNLGVNIYTTLNVQHLESLNDIVAQISGIIVRETLPDKVLEKADDVELVDIPPDDLLKRLQDGKVYFPETIQRATQNFFKKSTLTALREIALRTIANRVNADVEDYRRQLAVTQTWATADRILVCVSPNPSSANLVRVAHRMAKSLQAKWIALYMETSSQTKLPKSAREQAIQHLRLAEQLGAEVTTLTGENFADEVLHFARERNVTKIFIGKPPKYSWRNFWKISPVDQLLRLSGEIDIYATQGETAHPFEKRQTRFATSTKKFDWQGYKWAIFTVALCTGIAWILHPHAYPATLIMIYLFGILVLSHRQRLGPSILASFLSVAIFSYCFVFPRFSFAIGETQYLFTFFVMLLVGLSISNLTVRNREQARLSRLRENRTAALYSLSRELASTYGTMELIKIAVKHISEIFESSVIALLPDAYGHLQVRYGELKNFNLTPKEWGVAHWAYDLGQIAGLGTDTLPGAEAIYVPLLSSGSPVGALGVKPSHPEKLLIPEQLHLLEAFAHQAAQAIASSQLAEQQQQTKIQVQSEQLWASIVHSLANALLSPLGTIVEASRSLSDPESSTLSPQQIHSLGTIQQESERMRRLVHYLKEMAQIESGVTQLKKEPFSPSKVIGSAIAHAQAKFQNHTIIPQIPSDLPLIPMDHFLMEQALIHLLDHALKYTPPKTSIEITAQMEDNQLVVQVADQSTEFSENDLPHLFDKFYHPKTATSTTDYGLGLSICKAIIQSHGGIITAAARPSGGLIIRFSIPQKLF